MRSEPTNLRMLLGNVPAHSIVFVEGRWGVVEGIPGRAAERIVDFWWEGRERVPSHTIAEVKTKRDRSKG